MTSGGEPTPSASAALAVAGVTAAARETAASTPIHLRVSFTIGLR
jgi:hypothetical protein